MYILHLSIMGYNAAKDLLHQLGIDSDSEEIMSDLNI